MGVTADLPAEIAPAPPARIAGVQLAVRGGDVVAMVALAGPLKRLAQETNASDPDPANGTVSLDIPATGPATLTPASAGGVMARIVPRGKRSTLQLRAPAGRFFAVSYDLQKQPDRLVVRLWSAAPTQAQSYGPSGCLTLSRIVATPGKVTVGGQETHVFEHSFAVQLRDAIGRVLETRSVVSKGGRFSVTLKNAGAVGGGTVEAFAESAKDGSLACLARRPVTFR
jgi:Immunoglobulin-like domain of bacterial spore germination